MPLEECSYILWDLKRDVMLFWSQGVQCRGYSYCPYYSVLYVVQFVFVSLAGWGLLIYGGYKFFTSGSSKEVKEVVQQAATPAH